MLCLIYFQVENLTVQCTGNGRKIWRLAVPDPEGKVEEELVVRFQGIISKVELQPGDVSKSVNGYKEVHQLIVCQIRYPDCNKYKPSGRNCWAI